MKNMKTIIKNPLFDFENANNELGFEVPELSMFGMLKLSAESHPDALAYEYFGTKCSYRKLVTEIEHVSGC